ncbi:MAG TPA: hypothetical protein VIH06_15135 [Ilumatobacteraceae bacterium]
MLQPHFVHALVQGWDEFDERDDLPVEHFQRLGGNDQGDRAAVPDILAIGDRVAFDEPPHMQVLVPIGDTVSEVAQTVWDDVNAACQQPGLLFGGECR